ncbi:hypothetical protein [Zunongwangia endophytica]|uniref:DUF3298 domain-containing protein n=1 Tax=Zunongwangia endophytica TaxID=1808945 RepID=A0ABV8H6J4_9FLAO|nr:hypothetical protein [Zunongwangia endophytica]MDN3595964.1 hypothetical protein [Zunongwangia endophytica]
MHQEDKIENHQEFISKLETSYGKFNSENKKFESTSNSKIARDLCYSDSQFSRLINGTASEGEFKRALRNVNRLLNENSLQKKNILSEKAGNRNYKKWAIYLCLLLLVGIIVLLGIQFLKEEPADTTVTNTTRYDMLKWSFENNYIQPYIKLKDLPADCNFPCYKYQGKWSLKGQYKIPFFRERNGFHYVAKEAKMYTRCMDEENQGGELFEGYEYQKHEIWYDKREFTIDSFLVADDKSKIRESYNNSDFSENENFVKVAYVHTFFRNEFTIDSNLVFRKGKTIGRDIEFLVEEKLIKDLGSQKLVKELKSEINSIARNRLEDFSKPINCEPSKVPNINFNYVKKGDELSFECQFTTGRFLVDYEKIFVLEEQYINNICR